MPLSSDLRTPFTAESPYAIVDACVGEAMSGNAAAIVRMNRDLPDTQLLRLAQEMDEPVTAFIARREDERSYDIRWFTRNSELRICGHATLAASEWLLTGTESGPVEWHSRAGVLTASRQLDRVRVEFPATDLQPVKSALVDEIEAAIGVRPVDCFIAGDDYLAVMGSAEFIVSHAPDAAAIARLDCRGLIVTAPAAAAPGIGPDHDFVSRFFAPRIALPEDEVCVSAHCALYPYWSRRLDRRVLTAWQASPRGGLLELSSHRTGRVVVIGSCRQTGGGTVSIDDRQV